MFNRREFIGALPMVPAVTLATSARGADSSNPTARLPSGARVPAVEFIYECDVTLSEVQPFGKTYEGTRRIIPITGGTFQGPHMRGEVVSGGADWNLTRSDGAGSVEAAYYLKTDDGIIIRIVNKGIHGAAPADTQSTDERFFMFTTPTFEAPIGKYDWMNRSVFIATLGARHDAKNAVLIRVFKVV
jgi:hypothetical protein